MAETALSLVPFAPGSSGCSLLPSIFHAVAEGICTPAGRPPWMAAVFGTSHGWRVRKCRRDVTLALALCRLVLSLVTFFAPAKKVTRLQAKAFDLYSRRNEGQDQAHFALTREFISFAGPKETNQRKGPSPTRRNGAGRPAGIFGLAIPWLDPKTAAIHGRRPPGVQISACGRAIKQGRCTK